MGKTQKNMLSSFFGDNKSKRRRGRSSSSRSRSSSSSSSSSRSRSSSDRRSRRRNRRKEAAAKAQAKAIWNRVYLGLATLAAGGVAITKGSDLWKSMTTLAKTQDVVMPDTKTPASAILVDNMVDLKAQQKQLDKKIDQLKKTSYDVKATKRNKENFQRWFQTTARLGVKAAGTKGLLKGQAFKDMSVADRVELIHGELKTLRDDYLTTTLELPGNDPTRQALDNSYAYKSPQRVKAATARLALRTSKEKKKRLREAYFKKHHDTLNIP